MDGAHILYLPVPTHLLQDGTPEDEGDEVGVADRRQTVGHHDAGAPHLHERLQQCEHIMCESDEM